MPTPKQVHLGLSADPRTSIVALWRTQDDTTAATTMRYGEASPMEHSVDGLSFYYQEGFGNVGPTARMHQVHLCGLKADTTYHYQVGGQGTGGQESWSPEYTFRTAPDLTADPSAQVTIAVLGDTRDGYADWQHILTLAQASTPDVIFFTGDAVTFGQLQDEWDSYFDMGQDVLARVPMIFAEGNHETNATPFFSNVANPGDQLDFSIDYGAVHLTVLNDSPVVASTITGAAAAFLSSDLAAHASAPWKIFMHHQPMYSSSTGHGSNLTLRAAWAPIVDQYAVDLVVNGHDHDYERSKPLRANAVVPDGMGTVYIVSGSAGAPLYDNGSGFFTVTSEKTESFLILGARVGQLDVAAYRGDGTPLENFTLTK
jgi:hypothetical protein